MRTLFLSRVFEEGEPWHIIQSYGWIYADEKPRCVVGLFAFYLIHIQKGIASQLEEMHNSALLGIFCFLLCLYSTASPQAAVGFFPSSVVLFLYWNENLNFIASLAWVLYCKDSTAVPVQNWCFSNLLCCVWEQMVPWQHCSLAVTTVWLSRAGLLMWGGRMNAQFLFPLTCTLYAFYILIFNANF